MCFPPPKEKPDAAAARQALVRQDLETAEKEYNRKQAAAGEAMRAWFFPKAEATI